MQTLFKYLFNIITHNTHKMDNPQLFNAQLAEDYSTHYHCHLSLSSSSDMLNGFQNTCALNGFNAHHPSNQNQVFRQTMVCVCVFFIVFFFRKITMTFFPQIVHLERLL